jgi:integrative and conjugative element protein (TIGR02256 family)
MIAWLNSASLANARAHATSHLPNETGGLLLGYWHGSDEVVITCVTRAGPAAHHSKNSYKPDYGFDERCVARAYAASGGTVVYLGDWHSHPNTTRPYLSSKDKHALWSVARSDEARAPKPLSLVLAGNEAGWSGGIWRAELSSLFFWRTLSVQSCRVRLFD